MADNITSQTTPQRSGRVAELLQKRRDELLNQWIRERLESGEFREELISKKELRRQSGQIIDMLAAAIRDSGAGSFDAAEFGELRSFLNEISRERAVKGYTPIENASYVLALRNALRPMLAEEHEGESGGFSMFVAEIAYFAELIDRMSLVMIENYLRSREEIIHQQRADMMELSTPVIKVWDKILTLPIIGTLDSRRAQVMMEALLQKIVETGSTIAILDITGVRTMDTLVANHLIKTVTAARLMGARCILTGVSPAIAQTMVQLGIDLTQITTRAQMSDGIKLALEMSGRAVVSARALSAITQKQSGGASSDNAIVTTTRLAAQGSGIVDENKLRERR